MIQITKLCLKEMLCLSGRHLGICPRSPKTMNSLAPVAFRGKWSGSHSTVNTLLSLCLLEWKVFIWSNQSVIQTNSSVNWECRALVTCLTSSPLPVHYHPFDSNPSPTPLYGLPQFSSPDKMHTLLYLLLEASFLFVLSGAPPLSPGATIPLPF